MWALDRLINVFKHESQESHGGCGSAPKPHICLSATFRADFRFKKLRVKVTESVTAAKGSDSRRRVGRRQSGSMKWKGALKAFLTVSKYSRSFLIGIMNGIMDVVSNCVQLHSRTDSNANTFSTPSYSSAIFTSFTLKGYVMSNIKLYLIRIMDERLTI